ASRTMSIRWRGYCSRVLDLLSNGDMPGIKPSRSSQQSGSERVTVFRYQNQMQLENYAMLVRQLAVIGKAIPARNCCRTGHVWWRRTQLLHHVGRFSIKALVHGTETNPDEGGTVAVRSRCTVVLIVDLETPTIRRRQYNRRITILRKSV